MAAAAAAGRGDGGGALGMPPARGPIAAGWDPTGGGCSGGDGAYIKAMVLAVQIWSEPDCTAAAAAAAVGPRSKCGGCDGGCRVCCWPLVAAALMPMSSETPV